MPDFPCCDCCIGDDCEAGHDEPCDIHQLPPAEREPPWLRP